MITFNSPTKHGAHSFAPGVSYSFEPDVEHYFVSAGWATATDDAAVMTVDDVHIDPETIFGSGPRKGELVVTD